MTSATFHRPRYVLVAAAAAVMTLLAWFWLRTAERRAVVRLDPQARRALYERTLQTLRHPCADPKRPSALDDFCAGQAEFILEFPECTAECQRLASASRPAPTR